MSSTADIIDTYAIDAFIPHGIDSYLWRVILRDGEVWVNTGYVSIPVRGMRERLQELPWKTYGWADITTKKSQYLIDRIARRLERKYLPMRFKDHWWNRLTAAFHKL